ncbi:MAG: ParB N-terminal domain-containing protein [Phycisphaerae bacterium]|nr:ParB N-terminal domain-containing protein [Phycisphaerae bacterium]NIP55354.1 ParB N-terminal domain-containing protein [Phycisphaerae bacterium]NIS54123.1 ParB N-terminal domain-containing protein [Phycisphaerae bacterium]NIU11675.1 ParB N-terminal domain-containing protein [Phycisphaerae bacterium]NIU59497.1 ParB N-terminal domain-containing protein [Phycisphaerae bacterium]
MTNSIQSIALDKLEFHPDNPNKQSRVIFAKLVRNIGRTGRYEPLIVRPCLKKAGRFQIINGHHRWQALARLGYEKADCIIWDINDEETDILLTTLNRLGGSDQLDKKLKLLKRLNKRLEYHELAKFLPQTVKQIERLTKLKKPIAPAKINAGSFANPLVFFVNDTQQQQIEKALSMAKEPKAKMTKAAKRAAALARVAQTFLNMKK